MEEKKKKERICVINRKETDVAGLKKAWKPQMLDLNQRKEYTFWIRKL